MIITTQKDQRQSVVSSQGKKVYLVLKKSRKVAVFIHSVAQWLCLYSYNYYLKSYLKSYYSCAVADFQALITWLSRQVLIVISKAEYVLKQVQKISHLPWKEAGSPPQLRGCQTELFLRLHKHGSTYKFAGLVFKWIDFNSNLSCAAKLVSPEKQFWVNMRRVPPTPSNYHAHTFPGPRGLH